MPQTEQDSKERTAEQDNRGPRAARMSPQNVQATAADAPRVKSDGKIIAVVTALALVLTGVIAFGLLNDEPWAVFIWNLLSFLDSLGS